MKVYEGITNKADIERLHDDAIPIDYDDWGSERNIKAQKAFFAAVKEAIGDANYLRMEKIIEDSSMIELNEVLNFGLNCVAFGIDKMEKVIEDGDMIDRTEKENEDE